MRDNILNYDLGFPCDSVKELLQGTVPPTQEIIHKTLRTKAAMINSRKRGANTAEADGLREEEIVAPAKRVKGSDDTQGAARQDLHESAREQAPERRAPTLAKPSTDVSSQKDTTEAAAQAHAPTPAAAAAAQPARRARHFLDLDPTSMPKAAFVSECFNVARTVDRSLYPEAIAGAPDAFKTSIVRVRQLVKSLPEDDAFIRAAAEELEDTLSLFDENASAAEREECSKEILRSLHVLFQHHAGVLGRAL